MVKLSAPLLTPKAFGCCARAFMRYDLPVPSRPHTETRLTAREAAWRKTAEPSSWTVNAKLPTPLPPSCCSKLSHVHALVPSAACLREPPDSSPRSRSKELCFFSFRLAGAAGGARAA